jgi:hypothetical protein
MAINWDMSSHFLSSEWGQISFTIGATSISGVKMKLETERIATFAGYETQYSFSILAKASAFTTQPVPMSTKVVYGGVTYLCIGKQLDDAGVMLRIDLGETF